MRESIIEQREKRAMTRPRRDIYTSMEHQPKIENIDGSDDDFASSDDSSGSDDGWTKTNNLPKVKERFTRTSQKMRRNEY